MSLELLEAGYNNPPSGLSTRARVLLAYVCYRCRDQEFYERLPKVAKRTGLSLATVKRAIKELRAKGLLKFQEGGGGAACVYLVELQTSVNCDPSLKETKETSVNTDPSLTHTNSDGETSVNTDPGGSVNPDPAPGSAVTLPLDKQGISKKISNARAREALEKGASPPRNGQQVTQDGLAKLLSVARGGRPSVMVTDTPSQSPGTSYEEQLRDISRRARKMQEKEAKRRPRRKGFVRLVK